MGWKDTLREQRSVNAVLRPHVLLISQTVEKYLWLRRIMLAPCLIISSHVEWTGTTAVRIMTKHCTVRHTSSAACITYYWRSFVKVIDTQIIDSDSNASVNLEWTPFWQDYIHTLRKIKAYNIPSTCNSCGLAVCDMAPTLAHCPSPNWFIFRLNVDLTFELCHTQADMYTF